MSTNLQDRITEVSTLLHTERETFLTEQEREQVYDWFTINGRDLLAAYIALLPACEAANKRAHNAELAEKASRDEAAMWKDSAFKTAAELSKWVDKVGGLRKHLLASSQEPIPYTCKECGGFNGFHFHFCSES